MGFIPIAKLLLVKTQAQAIDPDGRVLLRAEAEPQLVLVKVGESGRSDPRVRYLDLMRNDLYEVGPRIGRSG